jgi:hypothetical protein
VSENYTVATHPRTAPFEDGSWVASTLDSGNGSALVDAVASGKFQVAVTRRFPSAARVYQVTSAPPLDMLGRFGGCIDVLQPAE